MENQPEHPHDDRAAVLVSKISGKPIRPLQVSLAALSYDIYRDVGVHSDLVYRLGCYGAAAGRVALGIRNFSDAQRSASPLVLVSSVRLARFPSKRQKQRRCACHIMSHNHTVSPVYTP